MQDRHGSCCVVLRQGPEPEQDGQRLAVDRHMVSVQAAHSELLPADYKHAAHCGALLVREGSPRVAAMLLDQRLPMRGWEMDSGEAPTRG